MDERLRGRTVMLSGASSGIGKHLAGSLVRAGARVILGARRTELTQDLAKELIDQGGDALAVPLDVTEQASIIEAFDAGEAEFGIVDTIIANAGTVAVGRSINIDHTILHSVIDTNLLGVYLLAREGAKRIIQSNPKDKPYGRILLVGSITSRMTGQGDAAYAATKAGVEHLGRQFAREWIRHNINVNTIQPGYIRTQLSGGWFDTERGRDQIDRWHRQRLMEIDALDELVIYLSSSASRYVTGGTFTVDDGQSL